MNINSTVDIFTEVFIQTCTLGNRPVWQLDLKEWGGNLKSSCVKMRVDKLFHKAGHLVIAMPVFHITSLPNNISYYILIHSKLFTSDVSYIQWLNSLIDIRDRFMHHPNHLYCQHMLSRLPKDLKLSISDILVCLPPKQFLPSFLGLGCNRVEKKHQRTPNPKSNIYRRIFWSVMEDRLHPLVVQNTAAWLLQTALSGRQSHPFTSPAFMPLSLHVEPSLRRSCIVNGVGLSPLAFIFNCCVSDLHMVTPPNTRELHYNIPMNKFKSFSHPLTF